ncbi:unnamed protein product [Cyclocybe aegerita]|uniref:non-specific serine/threonine protein kinase n=1 Tax=Cyclocybe aegerita TaxID=1973307 RepID=A0A8S0WIH4_CYCAE|nr:unnamed protein product [Cyclocybe aegerita]
MNEDRPHKTQRSRGIFLRVKALLHVFHSLASSLRCKGPFHSSRRHEHTSAHKQTPSTGTSVTSNPVPILIEVPISNTGAGPPTRRMEIYPPGHQWQALNNSERYTSLACLCTHLGDQLPLQLVKLVARDVLRGLREVHEKTGEAYGGISPTNILLSQRDLRALVGQLRADTDPSLYRFDLSTASLVQIPEPKETENEGCDGKGVFSLAELGPVRSMIKPEDDLVQALRAPEALLEAPCYTSMDVWALGCLLFELLTGEPLFDPNFQTRELDISREESHLIQMIELFGEMPKELVRAGTLSERWFTEDGCLRIETTYYPVSLRSVLQRHIDASNVEGTTEFLEMMLKLRPEVRACPKDMINHPWFSN